MNTATRSFWLAILGGLLFVGPAQAHAEYLRSTPGSGAVVSTPPTRVDIWFTQDVFRRQGENWIHVFGPEGESVHSGEAQVDDDDRRHIWVLLLPDLGAGEYRVEWRNLSSEDAHSEEGSFSFTVDPQAAATSTPMEPATETPSGTTSSQPTVSPTMTSSGAAPSGPCGSSALAGFGLIALFGARRVRKPLHA